MSHLSALVRKDRYHMGSRDASAPMLIPPHPEIIHKRTQIFLSRPKLYMYEYPCYLVKLGASENMAHNMLVLCEPYLELKTNKTLHADFNLYVWFLYIFLFKIIFQRQMNCHYILLLRQCHRCHKLLS